MAVYTWTTFPVSGSASFESTARTVLELWRSNAASMDAEIETARGGQASVDTRLGRSGIVRAQSRCRRRSYKHISKRGESGNREH